MNTSDNEKNFQALFPIGHLTKPEVRALARQYDLPTASRRESMGICFVGKRGHFDEFLGTYILDYYLDSKLIIILHTAQYITPVPGNIVDMHGNVLGRHKGMHAYTIGQGAKLSGQKQKMFVARKNKATNEIVIVDRG